MTRNTKLALVLVSCAGAFAPLQGHVEMLEREGTFGGLDVTYRVVLPDDYDASAHYPVVLHLVGGSQNLEIVQSSLTTDWQALAEEQGLIVVSPVSPNGDLFFRSADVIFPDFLDFLIAEYQPEGGLLQVTGHSNGGLSAFHVASLYPEYFISVTGYPGLLNDTSRMEALAGLCIFMHVGDQDPGWLGAMEQQAADFERLGYAVAFTIEPGHVHRLDTTRDNLAQRLFDELAMAREGC